MSEYILEMRNIVKRFWPITANDHVTLQVKQGEIFALLGENGAGKSTLMSILSGMYEPDEGEIFLFGKRQKISSPKEAANLKIGMVHQHFKLLSEFSITENIILGMEPHKKILGLFPYVDMKSANEKVARLSEKYNLKVDPKMLIKDADIYIRQRVEILKMLYRDAEILIFDEPTALLSPQEIQTLLSIIKGLRDKGKTILLITHKLDEIKKTADRCAILCRGVRTGIVDAKTASPREMARLMVGRDVEFGTKKKAAVFGKEVLKAENLCVGSDNRQEEVKKVSFSIHEGEIFAIAGVAGNGQSKIAQAIAGILPVKSGEIYLNGKNITRWKVRERSLEGISYVPQDRQEDGVILDFNLEENLALKQYFKFPFCKKGVLQKRKFEDYGKHLIAKYDIRSSRGTATIVRSMSGGNQQKAVIAREIEQEAKLLIFVQPTRGLDIGAIEKIHSLIIQERDKKKAILLISLELDEVMNCADTIGVIFDGRLLKTAPAKEMTQNEVGRYMMGEEGTGGEGK